MFIVEMEVKNAGFARQVFSGACQKFSVAKKLKERKPNIENDFLDNNDRKNRQRDHNYSNIFNSTN